MYVGIVGVTCMYTCATNHNTLGIHRHSLEYIHTHTYSHSLTHRLLPQPDYKPKDFSTLEGNFKLYWSLYVTRIIVSTIPYRA